MPPRGPGDPQETPGGENKKKQKKQLFQTLLGNPPGSPGKSLGLWVASLALKSPSLVKLGVLPSTGSGLKPVLGSFGPLLDEATAILDEATAILDEATAILDDGCGRSGDRSLSL